jgi:superoxide dismutase
MENELRKLDAEVAKNVMNWPEVEFVGRWQYRNDELTENGGGVWRSPVPCFSSSIEDAMEVVEKMRERGYQWSAHSSGKGWMILCYKNEKYTIKKFRGALLPELICRAALNAITNTDVPALSTE